MADDGQRIEVRRRTLDVDSELAKARELFDLHHEMTYHEMCAALERAHELAGRLAEALVWIHVHLGSECDWDELAEDDDGPEARWYRDTAAVLAEWDAQRGQP